MKTIWYAVENKINVPDDATDAQIEEIIKNTEDNKNFVWSEKPDVLCERSD